jgi:histone H3/H4
MKPFKGACPVTLMRASKASMNVSRQAAAVGNKRVEELAKSVSKILKALAIHKTRSIKTRDS